MRKDRYTVWYTEDGFNMMTTFESQVSCDFFARKMAEEGKLLMVKDGEEDITEEYVTVIKIN